MSWRKVVIVGRWPVEMGCRERCLWQVRREPRQAEIVEDRILRTQKAHLWYFSAGILCQEFLAKACGLADGFLGVVAHVREFDVARYRDGGKEDCHVREAFIWKFSLFDRR